jgi:WD40 repeat protein
VLVRARELGKLIALEELGALRELPPLRELPAAKPQRYELWKERRRLDVGFSHLTMADLSDDDRYLLAVSENEARLRIYEWQSGRLLASNPVSGYAQYGRGEFVWQSGSGTPPPVLFAHAAGIDALDALTGRSARQLSPEGAWELRFSDDGAVLIANESNLDLQTSRLVCYAVSDAGLEPRLRLRFSERVDGFDLSPDNALLAVTYYPSNSVELFDLRQGRLLWTMPGPDYAGSLDIAPDAGHVAVGGNAVVIYDLHQPEQQARFTDLGNNVDHVRFSPSSDALAVSAYDGKIRLLGRRQGAGLPLRKVLRHAGTANVYALDFTRDGSRLVSSSGDRTLRIWGE